MAIYIIKYKLCKEFYVGKTETTIRQRLKVRLRMIRNFYPFKFNCNSDVKHFNLAGHDYFSRELSFN